MPIEVELPTGEIAEFPDSMSQEEIRDVMLKQFPPQETNAPQSQVVNSPPPPESAALPQELASPEPGGGLAFIGSDSERTQPGGGLAFASGGGRSTGPQGGMRFLGSELEPEPQQPPPTLPAHLPVEYLKKSPKRIEGELELYRKEMDAREMPLSAAAITGGKKGSMMLPTMLHSVADIQKQQRGIYRSIPGIDKYEAIKEKAIRMGIEAAAPLRSPGWRAAEEAIFSKDTSTDPYFAELKKWEDLQDMRDQMLGKPTFGSQLTESVARGAVELPVQMAGGLLGAASGPAGMVQGSAAVAGATSTLMGYGQERGEGADFPTALTRGTVQGAIDGLSTLAFGATGVEAVFKKGGPQGVWNLLKHAIKEGGMELSEEGTAQVGQDLFERFQKNPNKPVSDSVREVILAAITGGLLGAGVNVIKGAGEEVGAIREKKQAMDLPSMPLQTPIKIEGGEKPNASKEQEAAKVHGDVQSQQQVDLEKIQPLPKQESEPGVQQKAEGGILKPEAKKPLSQQPAPESDPGFTEEESKRYKELWLKMSRSTEDVSMPVSEIAEWNKMHLRFERLRARAFQRKTAHEKAQAEAEEKAAAQPAAEPATPAAPEAAPKPEGNLAPLSDEERARHLEMSAFWDRLSDEERVEFDELDQRARADMVRAVTGEEPTGEVLGRVKEAERLINEEIVDQGLDPNKVQVEMPTPDNKGVINSPYLASYQKGTGIISVNLHSLANDLANMKPSRRKQMVKSVINEEWVHSHATDSMAKAFFDMASGLERAIARRIYTDNWKGLIKDEKGEESIITDEALGHEIMRRRLQRLNRMTVTEVATTVRKEHWTVKQLDRIDNLIALARRSIPRGAGGVKARAQLELLNKLQDNIKHARKAISAGDKGEIRALRKGVSNKVTEFTEMVSDPQVKLDNADSVDVGMAMKSIEDLDALLQSKRDIRGDMESLKDEAKKKMAAGDQAGFSSAMNRASVLGTKNQIIRETIETATNLGGWSEEMQTAKDKPLGERPLDWQANPEVKQWIEKNGKEVGISLPEEGAVLGALRRQLNGRQIEKHHKLMDALKHLNKVSVARLNEAVYKQERNAAAKHFAAVVPREKHSQTLFDTWRQFFSKWQYLDHATRIELLGEDVDEAMDEFANQWMGSDEQVMQYTDDLIRDMHEKDSITGEEDEQSLIMARRKNIGLSQAAIDRMEKLRKLREAKGLKPVEEPSKPGVEQGAAPRKVPRKERMAAGEFFAKPTPESITTTASEVLADERKVPSFKRFLDHVRSKHGDIQAGQVSEAWVDNVWKFLTAASGEQLNKLIDRSGLRRQVFGIIPQGSKTLGLKGAPPTLERTGDIADVGVDVGGIEVARQRAFDRAGRMSKQAEKLEGLARSAQLKADSAREAGRTKEVEGQERAAAEFRQKASLKRAAAQAQEFAAKTGEGVEMETPFLFLEQEGMKPEDWHDPVKGPQRKARDRAIAILGNFFIHGREDMNDELTRKTIGPEDIRWHEQGADIVKVTPGDLQDLDQLGMKLTAKAGVDATTKKIRGGGRFVMREKATPRSHTKRVIAFKDKKSGAIYMVDGYRDSKRGPVFLDPHSVTGEHRTLEQLISRLEPVKSYPLDKPVKDFFWKHANEQEWNTKFDKSVTDMSEDVGYRGFEGEEFVTLEEAEAEVEGDVGKGVEGEGGFVQGPMATITRAELGMVRGARDSGYDITPNEARQLFREFRFMDTSEDVETRLAKLKRRAELGRLRPQDFALIAGMSKINDSMTTEDHTPSAEEVLNEIYALTQRAEKESTFTKSVPGRFAQQLRVPAARAQAAQQVESPYAKELSMPLDRVPPTLVRPEQLPAYSQPVAKLPAPPSDVVGGGLEIPRKTPRTSAEEKYRLERKALRSARFEREVQEGKVKEGQFTYSAEVPPELGPFLPPKQKEKPIKFTKEELADWRKQQETNQQVNKTIADVAKAVVDDNAQTKMALEGKASEGPDVKLPPGTHAKKKKGQIDPNQGKLFSLRRNEPEPPPSRHTFSRILSENMNEDGNYNISPYDVSFDELSLLIGWPVDGHRGKGTPGSFEGSHDEDDLVRAVEDGRKPIALFDEVPLYVPPGLKVIDRGGDGHLGRYGVVKEGQEWASDALDAAIASDDNTRIGKALGFTDRETEDFKRRNAMFDEHMNYATGELEFTKEEVMNAMSRAMENDPDQDSFMFSRRRPAPEMDASLKESVTMAWKETLARNKKNQGKLRTESREAFNAGMADYAGVESTEELVNDFDDAIFNFAGTPNDEWNLNSKDRAALLQYFDDAEGTEHDRSLQIKGRISGEEYLADYARSLIARMESAKGNFGTSQAQELNNRIAVQRNILKDHLKNIDRLKSMQNRYPPTEHAPKPTDELPPPANTQDELFALKRISKQQNFFTSDRWKLAQEFLHRELNTIGKQMKEASPEELADMHLRLNGMNQTIRTIIRDAGLHMDADGITPLWDTVPQDKMNQAAHFVEMLQLAEAIEKRFPTGAQAEVEGLEVEPSEAPKKEKVKRPVKEKIDPDKNQGQLMALRRTPPSTLAEATRNLLDDFGSVYDRWMTERIAEYGGRYSREFAGQVRQMMSEEKGLYGGLTPLIDRARRLAGGIDPGRTKGMGAVARLKEVPSRIKGSRDAMKAGIWLNKVKSVTRYTAVANVVDAIEGNIPIPSWADQVVRAAVVANYEIGKLLERANPNFQAKGLFQRNVNAFGYDIIKAGGGLLWDRWTEGIAHANSTTTTLTRVRENFAKLKSILDRPHLTHADMESIAQDFNREYPNVVTHVKHMGQWMPVIHSDLFNYLETAARRATHVVAFRSQYPNNDIGKARLLAMMNSVRAELPDALQDDLSSLITALHGHPSDDANTKGMKDWGMSPQQVGGTIVRAFNQTIGNLAAKAVLTGQMFVQPGELIIGSTPIFLGRDNYINGLIHANMLYDTMELNGSVNRVMSDYILNLSSPGAFVKSTFKTGSNLLAKASMQNMLNEAQESAAAATARVVSEKIIMGKMSDWDKKNLPQTFHMMGFSPREVDLMMKGDTQLLLQFQRKAAAWLTGGNKAVAEGSRLSTRRLLNSVLRFQTYPMVKANQFRRLVVNWADAAGSKKEGRGERIWNASTMMGRFLVGNMAQGAITSALTTLAYAGLTGTKIKWEEVKDEPWSFAGESFMASLSGPLYLLWRGMRLNGLTGVGEQATRVIFPWAITQDLWDMAHSDGIYRDTDLGQRIGRFVANKTPMTKAIKTGMAMAGLGFQSQPLDVSISALNRWKASQFPDEMGSFGSPEERREFRTHVRNAVDAMKRGDRDTYTTEWMAAAMTQDESIKSVSDSLKRRKVLVGPHNRKLTSDEKDSLQQRIGMEAYERLEHFDLMLDVASDGIIPVMDRLD